MMTRREVLYLLAGLGVGASATALSRGFDLSGKRSTKSHDRFTVSAVSLLHHDPSAGYHGTISLVGQAGPELGSALVNGTSETHFEIMFLDRNGRLTHHESVSLRPLQTKALNPPTGFIGSAFIVIQAPNASVHPEASAFVHHRTPWGEDGHHASHWLFEGNAVQVLPITKGAATLTAGTSFYAEALSGRLLVTDHRGELVLERNMTLEPFQTFYLAEASCPFRPPEAIILPDLPGSALQVRFRPDTVVRGIVFNSWRIATANQGSFSSFHGVTSRAVIEAAEPFGGQALEANVRASDLMLKHRAYPVDLVCRNGLPGAPNARSILYMPNLATASTRIGVAFFDETGKLAAKTFLKSPETPQGGTLIIDLQETALDHLHKEGWRFGSAVADLGAHSPPQSVAKILTLTGNHGAGFMQHLRPQEVVVGKEALPDGSPTDYWIATPGQGENQLLIRNHGQPDSASSVLEIVRPDGSIETKPLGPLPSGHMSLTPISGAFQAIRVSAQDAFFKLSLLRKDDQNRLSVSHGTSRHAWRISYDHRLPHLRALKG